jgi:carboxyl-terminal processing protease
MANEKDEKKSKKKTVVKRKKVKEETKEIKKEEEKVESKRKKLVTYSNKETIIIMVLSIVIGILFGSAITRFLCEEKGPKGLNEFDRIYSDIYNNKYSNTSKGEMLSYSLNGLLSSLNDRYAYVDESKNALLLHDQEEKGEFIGLGVYVFIDENGKINIQSVYEDSPASKAGLESGDIIVKLNGNYYDTNNYDSFSYNVLSANKGDKVELVIERNNEQIKKEVKLDNVVLNSVSYRFVDEDDMKIGVFGINNYADNTCDQFEKYYDEALKDGIQAIVLDLRDNTEGLMKNAKKIASLFLDKGDIIYQTYRNGKYEEVVNNSKREINLPVVVIVNNNTMGTAEMLASTLHENLNADIVGTTTFGKGYIQKVLPLFDENAVVYSVKEWVTSNKNKVEEIGINPTIEISQEECTDNDAFMEKAIESLKKMVNVG